MPTPLPVGTTVDLRQLVSALTERARRAADLRPFYRAVVDPDVTLLLRQQFASRGTRLRSGARWKRLAAATIRRKGHDQPLIDSGNLYDAFTDPSHPDAIRIIQKLRYSRGVGGQTGRIARYHEDGTENADGSERMPARPIMPGMPAPVRRAWSGEILRYLDTGALPGRKTA